MKKLICLLTLAAIIACFFALGAGAFIAHASNVSEEECDRVFIETLNELMPNNQAQITATKELIFDIGLEPLGYLYLFNLESEDGYAIVINNDGLYECIEIFIGAANPFGGNTGLKVYVAALVYWVYNNDAFYTVCGLEITQEVVEIFADKAYKASYESSSQPTYSTEVITFINRTNVQHTLALFVPRNTTTGPCVPVAGVNLIHYYQRFLPNLVPGFVPGQYMFNFYSYFLSSSAMTPIAQTLAIDMNTCPATGGTTIHGFHVGMTAFVSRQGYTFSSSSLMTNGFKSTFNYGLAKQRLDAGIPLVLFCDIWTAADIALLSNGTQESIHTMFDQIPHANVSFGYRDITYTLPNNTARTDSYLQVSTGLIIRSNGWARMDAFTVIDDAYSIIIS
jgi:hypothetical protein